MRLHWFREHQQLVYYVICPLIVISMSVFGVSSCSRGSIFGVSGPAISYVVGGKEFYLSPQEVLQKRIILYKDFGGYDPHDKRVDRNPTTDNIGLLEAEVETARQQNFELGFEEFQEILRRDIKAKIQSIDRAKEGDPLPPLTRELYEKLLAQLDISDGQFETLTHKLELREKFHDNLEQSIIVSDPVLFAKYCTQKENVRFRFKIFKSDDFLAKVEKTFTDADIKKFYDDNLDKKNDGKNKDIFLTPATLSLEALAYKDEKAFANIAAPTDAELKTTYDNFKGVLWKDPADSTKFQPFEKVKPEVEKKWRSDKITILKSTVEGNVTKAFNALAEDEKKFKDEEDKKLKADPKYKVKEFDMAAWAKAHDMIYWVTPAQTEEVYAKGKLAVNAPDLSLGTAILKYTKPEPNQPPTSMENQKKHMDEFTSFTWINPDKPELGGIRARKKVYVEEATKTLDQAKDKIVERLKLLESVKLAEEAADKQREEWRRGDNLPKMADLEEVISDKKESNPLVQRFRKNPKADGEVLDVVVGQPDVEKPDPKDRDKRWFYVGCAVERKLPSLTGYMKDTEWKSDAEKDGGYQFINGQIVQTPALIPAMIREDYDSMLGMMIDQIKSNVKRIGGEGEPDVRTSFRNSSSQGDY